MAAIASIAWLTFRESLRQKLAVNLLVFAVLLIAGSITVSTLTFGEQYRIIADLAFTAAQVFGTLIAVFVGAGLVAGDVQRKTLYPVITKRASRAQYVIGRYAGLLLTVGANLAVMAVATTAVLEIYTGDTRVLTRAPILFAFVGLAAQFVVVGAVAILFSCFTNATLAAIFTLSVAFAGFFARDLVTFWRNKPLLRSVGFVLPNLAGLDYKVAVVYQDPVAGSQLAWSLAYAGLYAAVVVTIATALFAHRDLK